MLRAWWEAATPWEDELGHEESTTGLVADEAAEDSVGDAGHGGQDGGRLDRHGADDELGRNTHLV